MTAEIPGLVVRYRHRKLTQFSAYNRYFYSTKEQEFQMWVDKYLEGKIDAFDLERWADYTWGIEPVPALSAPSE